MRALVVLCLLAVMACSEDKSPVKPPSDGGTFAPTRDVTLAGVHEYDEVKIPEGVTVTASGDLTLHARHGIEVAGSIVAEGSAIALRSDSSIVVSGTLRNTSSAAAGDTSAIALIANGDLSLVGATIRSAGDLLLQNDPTLVATDFPDSNGMAPRAQRGEVAGVIRVMKLENTHIVFDPATTGREGVHGLAGHRGRDYQLRVRGYLQFLGNVVIEGQAGGDGGRGVDRGNVDADAVGGSGGRGADVTIFATGEIYFAGTNIIRSGRGGDGGDANATGLAGGSGETAARATARGGRGGRPGLIDIRAALSISIEGPLSLEMGRAGHGGEATALAADGGDAGGGAPQRGGRAEAIGGRGGTTPNKRLIHRGVAGLDQVTVAGGDGGDGGNATATAGNGGDGSATSPDGADGGNAIAQGGNGGDALTTDAFDQPIGVSGDGGRATVANGRGGRGADRCDDPCESVEGGRGGKGGNGTAEEGAIGSGGRTRGVVRGVALRAVGCGGDGGSGAPRGIGGEAGTRIARTTVPVSEEGENFVPGDPGELCATESGACCLPSGECAIHSCRDCRDLQGEYRGNDSTCEPDPCRVARGACCESDGSCTVVALEGCTTGTYEGDGTTCDPNPCDQPRGACCSAQGSCVIASRAECDALGNAYQGDNVFCAPNPCPQPPTGACCNLFAGCTLQTEANCLAAGYVYMGNGVQCSTYPCAMACCFSDGHCEYISGAECVQRQGNTAGPDCDPSPCPGNFGACCYFNGWCKVVTGGACSLYGTYMGHGTTCDPFPCDGDIRGACCTPGQECRERSEFECRANQGTFLGLGTPCTPTICTDYGACCLSDGSCRIATDSTCVGAWQGRHTDCDPNPCPAPPGACCWQNGQCTLTTAEQCNLEVQVFQGAGTTCDPNPCPAFGACCAADGTCTFVPQARCSGFYQGDRTTCAQVACRPVGACCFPSRDCAQLERFECEKVGGVYGGHGTDCDPIPCPLTTGACCYDNGQCVQVVASICTGEIAEWQGDGSTCDPLPCHTGACCVDSFCRFGFKTWCDQRGGVYHGDGSACAPDPCGD